jgi:hypothetical protein
MLVIYFEKNRLLGGYGDRIVGLIAVQTLSKVMDREFRILWEKEDVKPYFIYAAYEEGPRSVIIDSIDNQKLHKQALMTLDNPFPMPETKFLLNQEISQYRFKDADTFFATIFANYRALYTTTLKPTRLLLDKVDKCIAGHQTIVGIQIRCGDCFMTTNKGEWYNTGARDHIHTYLTQIKNSLTQYLDYAVFVTSDYAGILEEARLVFDHVLYIDDPIQHIDRRAINEDISKVFADNYILSQRTTELFISANSNYGRVAALSAPHDRIYDVATSLPLDKRRLLSKGELIFAE